MKTIVFLGQAPPRPTSKTAAAGAYLRLWLMRIGLSEKFMAQYCHFYALVSEFPGSKNGSHIAPSSEQIIANRPRLIAAIKTINPDIIVPVGRLSITTLMPVTALTEVIGKVFQVNPYGALQDAIVCVPLAHPSGRSTWNYAHKDLVAESLDMLQLAIRGK